MRKNSQNCEPPSLFWKLYLVLVYFYFKRVILSMLFSGLREWPNLHIRYLMSSTSFFAYNILMKSNIYNILTKSNLVNCIWSWFRLTWLWGAGCALVPRASPCLRTLHHHHHHDPKPPLVVVLIDGIHLPIKALDLPFPGSSMMIVGDPLLRYLRAYLSGICCGDIFWSVPALSGTVSPLSGVWAGIVPSAGVDPPHGGRAGRCRAHRAKPPPSLRSRPHTQGCRI